MPDPGRAGRLLRVCQVITRSDSVGGAQVHLLHLAGALRDRGHEVVVLLGGDGPFVRLLRRSGIPCVPLRHLGRPVAPWRDAAALRELQSAIAAHGPDLVATHSSKAGVLGRLAAHRLGLPAVFTAHGWAFDPGVPAARRLAALWAERRAARWGEWIICVSEHDRRLADTCLRLPGTRVAVVPNGLPDHPARAGGGGPGPLRVVMVARFEAQKDHATLLHALAGLSGARALLLGEGPLLPSVRRQAERLGLADRVSFEGHRDDVPEALASADVLVLASRWEGLPLTVIEAMRAALPVVATAVGGVPEAVEDGVTGFLVPPGDARLLRARLQDLFDPARRLAMGRAGRNRFEARFGLDAMVTATLAVYRDAVRAGAPEAGA